MLKLTITIFTIMSSLLLIMSCSAESENNQVNKTEVSEAICPWLNLLEGDSLDLWKSRQNDELPKGWTLEGGVLHFIKAPQSRNSDLLTRKDYFDFELKFEFNVASKSNSGVKYRTDKTLGMEYQIIDDKYCPDIKKPEHTTGSIYGIIAAPQVKPLNPAGEWNSARIVAKGNKIEHWLNGVKIIDIEVESREWQESFAKSKYKGKTEFAKTLGPVFLQDHQDEVFYRGIFIKEIITQ